jgi:hypothetical protein
MAIAVDPNSRVYIHQINRLRGGGPPSSTRQCNPNALTMGWRCATTGTTGFSFLRRFRQYAEPLRPFFLRRQVRERARLCSAPTRRLSTENVDKVWINALAVGSLAPAQLPKVGCA